MKKGSKGRAWLWGLLILVSAGVLSYLVILGLKDTVVERETPEVDRGDAASIQEPVTEEKVETPTPSIKKEIYIATEKEEDDCDRIENNIAEYFLYLDQKEYIRNLDLEVNVYVRAKEILKKLAKHPPIPAGEGADHKMIIGNLYHFFRVLKGKDIRLVKEILKNEEENLEINLEMFYRWFILGDRCPDPENIRPSFDVLYQYAGFLINTTGGRAYLFRRSTSFRLLIT